MISTDGSQLDSLGGDTEANARNIYDGDNLGDPSKWSFSNGDSDNDDPIAEGPNEDTAAGAGHIRWRHGDDEAINMLFLDGHASTIRQGEVLNRNIRLD